MFDTDKFICEIRDRPCIWDTKEADFNNRVIKKAAWEEIAKIFDPTWEQQTIAKQHEYVDELQKKWKHIRDYYVRQKKRRIKTKRRGTTSYIDLLTFLDIKTEHETPSGDTCDQQELPVEYEAEEGHEDPLNSTTDEEDPVSGSSSHESDMIHFEEELITAANKKPKNADADTNFLLSLLPQVRSLSERQNCEFRMEVMNLLYKIKYRTPYTYYRTGTVVKKRRRPVD